MAELLGKDPLNMLPHLKPVSLQAIQEAPLPNKAKSLKSIAEKTVSKLRSPRSTLTDSSQESIAPSRSSIGDGSTSPTMSISDKRMSKFAERLRKARSTVSSDAAESNSSTSESQSSKAEAQRKRTTLFGALGLLTSKRSSFGSLVAGKRLTVRPESCKRKAAFIPTVRFADLVISPAAANKSGEFRSPELHQSEENVDELVVLLQSRGTIAPSIMIGPQFRDEADEEDPVLAFWRVSTRSDHVQVKMSPDDHLDYFVSHVWQPPPGFTNVDLYAQHKVQALEMFGRREAMLGGPNEDSGDPWFVLSRGELDRERELGHKDPGNDWRSYTCWVDKACANSVLPPRSDLEHTPNDLVRATKAALTSCRVFLAVITWHFFNRLWCIMEWARFLADAAPDYRRTRLVIHESLLQNRNWDRITESVSAFSLSTLRSGNDADHPELWLELEDLMVSSEGFERFIQVTAFALLVRFLLLRCTRHCLAFGTDSDCTRKVNTIIEACKKLKLYGLARGLGSSRPKHWWSLAIRHAKEEIEGNSTSQAQNCSPENAPISPESLTQPTPKDRKAHPMEELAHVMSKRLMGERAASKDKNVVNVPRANVNSESVAAASKAMQTLKARDAYRHLFTNAGAVTRGIVSEAFTSKFGEDQSPPKSMNSTGVGFAPVLPSTVQDECEGDQDHVAEMQKAIGGLPDGFSPFWRGATGFLLNQTDRVRARVFLRAWRNYREYVNRWFDRYVCPHIEVWRQRGIRARGLLEEAFGTMFMTVDGSLQMSLCDQLAPGLREFTLAAEPPPRGRPGRPCQAPWSNPTLDRLLVVSTGKQHDFPGSLGAGKKEKKGPVRGSRVSFSVDSEFASEKFKAPEPATIVLSPLGLELSGQPNHVVLRLNCGDGEVQTVQLPQRLGVEALHNAFNQLLHGAQQRQQTQIRKLEMEAIIPRMLIKVSGSECNRIDLGMRLVGTLSAKLDQEGPSAPAPALTDGSALSRSHSPQPPPLRTHSPQPLPLRRSIPTVDEDLTMGEDDAVDSIDWNRWQCRAVVDGEMTSLGADPSCSSQEEKKPIPAITSGGVDAANQQMGYPSYSSPGLTPRRDRALAALYVNYSDDPASTCISPRRHQVTALNPLSKSLLEKARNQVGLTEDQSLENSLALMPRRKNQGPGGLLPSAAVACPRQFPPMAELSAQAASPPWRMKALQASQPVDEFTSKQRTEEDLQEKSYDSTDVSAQAELIELMSRWEWSARAHGGPPEAPRNVTWTGTIFEIFNKLDEWIAIARRSGCPYFVPVSHMLTSDAISVAVPQALRVNGALIPTKITMGTFWDSETSFGDSQYASAGDDLGIGPAPLARSPPCSRCNHTDVANVSLEQSMLRRIWQSPSCSICLRCGLVTPLSAESPAEHRALDGDSVLEVTTSIMLKAGTAANIQPYILRVLRIDHGTVHIAAPAADAGPGLSTAKPSVAYLSFTTRTIGMVAAAACSHRDARARSSVRYHAFGQEKPTGLFVRDLDWAAGSLSDTGLDLVYGISKQIPINFAIGELDDRRTMPRRKDVCPLVLWAELSHVLSPEFEPNRWIHAVVEVCCHGKFSLPGAIMLRNNATKLRKAVMHARFQGKKFQGENAHIEFFHDEPKAWPLALHRVLVAREGVEDTLLGVALSGKGLKAGTPKELFHQGLVALTRIHSDKRKPSVARTSVMARTVQSTFAAEQGRPNHGKILDGTMVMHELVHRRESGDESMGERALLRARRVLRHIQVTEFLNTWHARVTDAEADWRNTHLYRDDDQVEKKQDDNDDDLVEDDDRSEDSDSDHESVENLLLQKVLGHIKEYVHHADVALKAWTVTNVIVQTCSKFCEQAMMTRARSGGDMSSTIEQRILDQGFVRTALRTLYRHHHRPQICEEVFTMLRHLVRPGHGFAPRTIAELSSPATNNFTFLMSLCHFSEANRIHLVTDNIQLLNLMFSKEHVETPPLMPEGREEEAAEALIPILYRHQSDLSIVMSIFELIVGMVRNAKMCCAFFTCGLTDVLRQWLLDSIEDKQLAVWVKVKEEAGQINSSVPQGASGRAADSWRRRAHAVNSLSQQVATCEIICWDLICTLTNGSTQCDSFLQDSQKTILHGLKEMTRRPRSRQWHWATNCLTQMVLHSTDAHAGRLIAAGCLGAISSEFPEGEVKEVMPLLIAILDESKPLPEPRKQPGESDDEAPNPRASSNESQLARARKSHFHVQTAGVEQQDMILSESSSSEEEGENQAKSEHRLGGTGRSARKALAHSAALKRYKPEAQDLSNASSMPKLVMIDKCKGWLIANKFVGDALKAMSMNFNEFTCEVRLKIMRVLASIFIPRYTAAKSEVDQLYLQARSAVAEFESFGEEYGGGLLQVLDALQEHLTEAEVVDTALFLLLGTFDMFQRIPERAADLEGFPEALVNAAWEHSQIRKTRRRALLVIRKVRDAKPTITIELSDVWQQKHTAFLTAPYWSNSSADGSPKVTGTVDAYQSSTGRDHRNRPKRPPGDMIRFEAVLRVHAFFLEHGQRPLSEALEPLGKYTGDFEICSVALSGITLGSKLEMQHRYKELQKVSGFAGIMRRAVEMYQDPATFTPVLLLVNGVLGTNPPEKEELVETCAIAVRIALENLEDKQFNDECSWMTADSWERFLEVAETGVRSPSGKEAFQQQEIPQILHDVWAHIEASDKDDDRAIVKLHKGPTTFLMELMGD